MGHAQDNMKSSVVLSLLGVVALASFAYGCSDTGPHCAYWQKQGHCTGQYKPYMEKTAKRVVASAVVAAGVLDNVDINQAYESWVVPRPPRAHGHGKHKYEHRLVSHFVAEL